MTGARDRIRFFVETLDDDEFGPLEPFVSVEINGVDLAQLVFEALVPPTERVGEEPGERGFPLGYLQEHGWPPAARETSTPVHDHWMGRPFEHHTEAGRTGLLTCTCNTFGCGGITARIKVEPDRVTWSEFHSANYGAPIPLRTYEFDRVQYEAALDGLPEPD